MNKSLCEFFNRASGFLATFHLTADFHCKTLWELLFVVQNLWAGKADVRLLFLPLLGRPLPLRCPFQCSTIVYGFGASVLHVFTPLHDVAASLYPEL